ncbi:MAG: hypothetical protein PHQ60_02100 [Sideroxydans sp.]|nr:hypothetical protein [Sideroxydans sp.]MDD5056635.1 hypothetical protein [Sideroxydans sp.]
MLNNEMAMLIGAVFLGVFSAILAAWIVRAISRILIRNFFWLLRWTAQQTIQGISSLRAKNEGHRVNAK